MNPRPALRADGVWVRFATSDGPREVLRGVDFEATPGEIVGIVGRSGVGKTVLLRTIGGLQARAAGSVVVNGAVVTRPPPGLVVVFQDYENALLPWRTVIRNVELGLEATVSKTERRARAKTALEIVGLADRALDHPLRLSGGMAQRVQLARAFALDPSVLLMDEPFGSLDAITKASLQDVVLDVHARTTATIVFVTHDLDEAIYLSDRVLVLAHGTIGGSFRTELPRPRDQLATRALPRFLSVRHDVAQALRDD